MKSRPWPTFRIWVTYDRLCLAYCVPFLWLTPSSKTQPGKNNIPHVFKICSFRCFSNFLWNSSKLAPPGDMIVTMRTTVRCCTTNALRSSRSGFLQLMSWANGGIMNLCWNVNLESLGLSIILPSQFGYSLITRWQLLAENIFPLLGTRHACMCADIHTRTQTWHHTTFHLIALHPSA